MTAKARLLIFIPTYRRPEALIRQLTALKHLRQANPGIHIDIEVSHNEPSSSRGQPAQELGVRHRFNPVNLGADINIALAFTACDGYDFLWILSDDDFLSQEADLPPLPFDDGFDLIEFNDAKGGTVETRQIGASDLLNSRMGLISDVIYRVASIRASLQESLTNVASCFPHLSVIAAAFARRAARIRYLSRSPTFARNPKYEAECVTDYGAARSGVLLLGKYLDNIERRRFAFFYIRHADLAKLHLGSGAGSLLSALRAIRPLSWTAAPALAAAFLVRKAQSAIR